MNLQEIIRTVSMVGASTPAFAALFENVKNLFGSEDQQTLQASYEQALARANDAHERAQSLDD